MTNQLQTYISLINENIEELERQFGVRKIAIFGSTARGEDTEKSDIDIIVELNRPIGFFSFMRLESHLKKILGKKVDLTTKASLKSTIKKNILKEAIYA